MKIEDIQNIIEALTRIVKLQDDLFELGTQINAERMENYDLKSQNDQLRELNQNCSRQASTEATDKHFYKDSTEAALKDSDYYRDLLRQIGVMLGPESVVCDDGGFSDDVLVDKLPSIVADRVLHAHNLERKISELTDVGEEAFEPLEKD